MAASTAGGGFNAPGIQAPAGAILVVNAGSSSLKAALIAPDESVLWREQWTWDATASGSSAQSPKAVLEDGLATLLWRCAGEMALVGHRVVHGGRRFTAPTRLDAQVFGELEQLVPLAPLHNPPALRVMHWLTARLPGLPQWACFDTAFHHTLPAQSYTYALPAAWRDLGLRRYGFHGLNHQHVSVVVHRLEGSGPEGPLRLISCHLGAGCSLCAIRGGLSIATTMGFTPMEGLVMASRCGSVDPGVLLDLLRRGVSAADLEQQLQTQSGLLGLSGLSGSMRDLRVAASQGHAGAQLAIAVFQERLRQGIGAMAASLGGVDVIALTGGIGEHDEQLRDDLRRDLPWLGPFRLHVVPADEEGVIARACRAAEMHHRQDLEAGGQPSQASAGSVASASTAAQAIGLANQ